MSKDLACSLVNFLCPICGEKHHEEIILNTKLSEKNADAIRSLMGRNIGFADTPCDKCQEIINQGALFIIGIDLEKSQPDNPYRSGHLVGIKRESEFVENLPPQFKEQDAIMMDYREMQKLGMI